MAKLEEILKGFRSLTKLYMWLQKQKKINAQKTRLLEIWNLFETLPSDEYFSEIDERVTLIERKLGETAWEKNFKMEIKSVNENLTNLKKEMGFYAKDHHDPTKTPSNTFLKNYRFSAKQKIEDLKK